MARKARRAGDRRGGARSGAGRPPTYWPKIRRLAEAGCTEEEIRSSLGLSDELWRDAAFVLRFRQTVDAAHATLKVRLRKNVLALSEHGVRGKSVNAALAMMRNLLSWDRPKDPKAGKGRPDQEAAVAEIERLLERIFRGKKRGGASGEGRRGPKP